MLKRIFIQILISVGIISIGIVLMLIQNWLFNTIGILTLTFGIICLFFLPIRTHIRYSKSVNVFICYLIAFMLLNILRHYNDFYIILNLKEYLDFMFHPQSTIYIISLSIWLIGAIGTIVFIVKKIRRKVEYKNLIKEKSYKIIFCYISLMVLFELPIYNWHGDFGGQLHGHNLWFNLHIH